MTVIGGVVVGVAMGEGKGAVIGGATGEAVVGGATGEAVVGAATGEPVVGSATGEAVVGAATGDAVVGSATGELLGTTVTGGFVVGAAMAVGMLVLGPTGGTVDGGAGPQQASSNVGAKISHARLLFRKEKTTAPSSQVYVPSIGSVIT
jgi:hypothetical protein